MGYTAPMANPISSDLTQTKLATSSRVGVLEACGAIPDILGYAFIIAPVGAPDLDLERLVRIATVSDISDVAIPANPLTYFRDGAEDFTALGAQAGDVLTFLAPPEEWGGVSTFTVFEVSGTRVRFSTAFPWKITVCAWELRRDGALIGSGVDGTTERETEGLSIFKDTQFQSMFTNAVEALNHITAVQANVRSLVDAFSFSGAEYLDYAPGNPISNTYEG